MLPLHYNAYKVVCECVISSRIGEGLLGTAKDMFRLLKFHRDRRIGVFFLDQQSLDY